MNALKIRNLCKQYPRFSLDQVSFDVKAGHITGFIGRNGAGKTTTLSSLLDLVHPDSGEISFFGLPYSGHEQEIRQRIGFVSGGIDYYPHKKLSVITDVTRRFYVNWDAAAYRACMERFSLDASKTPAQLSAGMKVKYALTLALSHHAELLILDEPTSGLDPVSREDLLELFLALKREGVSILFSTHITSDLEKCADDIVYIRAGRIAAFDGIHAFESRYRLLTVPSASSIPAQSLGTRISRDGATVLLDAACDLPGSRAATLEEIMVHLEKEDA